jgi:hypothetical protein
MDIISKNGTDKAAQQAAMLKQQREQERQSKLLSDPAKLNDEKCAGCGSIVWHMAYVLKEIPPAPGSPENTKPIPTPKPAFLCAGCGKLHPSCTAFVNPANTQA